MRFIKLILISGVVLFLLMLLLSLMIPSKIRISRAIDIQAPRERLLPYIQQRSNWPVWNAYAKDSTGRFDIRVVQVADTLVTSDWKAGDKSFTGGLAVYEPRSGTLTVQWYFDFNIKWYPWEKFGSILFDRQLGPVMEESLASLKQVVESNR